MTCIVTQPPGRHETDTILRVEDEDAIRKVAHRILEKLGYNVLVAADGYEAISVASAHSGTIHMIVADVMLRESSGPDVVEAVRMLRPEVRALYLSGYGEQTVVEEGLVSAGDNFLQKPFDMDQLARRIRAVLDAPPPGPTT